MEAEKSKLKGVCNKCNVEIFTLHAKVDAVKTYNWDPTTDDMEEIECEGGRTFAFTCPMCGEEIATNWDDAKRIFLK